MNGPAKKNKVQWKERNESKQGQQSSTAEQVHGGCKFFDVVS